MLVHTLLLLAVALATTASPLVVRSGSITIPLARHLNLTGGSARMVQRDQIRARSFAQGISVPVTDAVVTYTAQVQIGSQPEPFTLIVDTGSSNTWAGANPGKRLSCSNSSQSLGVVSVIYGSGEFTGLLCNETVTIGDQGLGLSIPHQGVAAAYESCGFDGVDGILGIGPSGLTKGSVVTSSDTIIPTVTDNAAQHGLIPKSEVGVSFEPTTMAGSSNGELTFGQIDPSKFNGPLNWIPITSTAPASSYVGIDQSITYGSDGASILGTASGIVDTGTTLLMLAQDSYSRYMQLTGAVPDQATGMLKINSTQYGSLQSLLFSIGGVTYEFTKDAQTWPRALNKEIGGTSDGIYLIVGNLGNIEPGLGFINGMAFLQRFYTAYDSTENRFGIATTQYTHATTNFGQ